MCVFWQQTAIVCENESIQQIQDQGTFCQWLSDTYYLLYTNYLYHVFLAYLPQTVFHCLYPVILLERMIEMPVLPTVGARDV
jgi:hypothetical protein